MVTPPYEWEILEWKENHKLTNKQTNHDWIWLAYLRSPEELRKKVYDDKISISTEFLLFCIWRSFSGIDHCACPSPSVNRHVYLCTMEILTITSHHYPPPLSSFSEQFFVFRVVHFNWIKVLTYLCFDPYLNMFLFWKV